MIAAFPQPNAFCVKSQDVYVIRSTFPNKGKQMEGGEQRQDLKVQAERESRSTKPHPSHPWPGPSIFSLSPPTRVLVHWPPAGCSCSAGPDATLQTHTAYYILCNVILQSSLPEFKVD
ncbi:hypothetical protein EYF80_010397 [Liparis tanakae]|uniref:Uncharacterized protein n=1 Tax=Liparis tanakae TaxID=230148 RepID=A0A4Z2IQD3_9TELE|nr:hypothetical protein EYF80_010397 [Liparis tanakae]